MLHKMLTGWYLLCDHTTRFSQEAGKTHMSIRTVSAFSHGPQVYNPHTCIMDAKLIAKRRHSTLKELTGNMHLFRNCFDNDQCFHIMGTKTVQIRILLQPSSLSNSVSALNSRSLDFGLLLSRVEEF